VVVARPSRIELPEFNNPGYFTEEQVEEKPAPSGDGFTLVDRKGKKDDKIRAKLAVQQDESFEDFVAKQNNMDGSAQPESGSVWESVPVVDDDDGYEWRR
jgi:hypothetical protein